MTDFNPNIPQGTDNLSVSQGQILNNFTQLNTIFDIDHYTYDDATTIDRGMHRQVHMPAPVADPTLSGTQTQLYQKTITGAQELFFANAAGVTQVTSGNLPVWKGGTVGSTGVVSSTVASNGVMNLPNGLQLRWGSAVCNTAGTAITFSSAFTTGVFSVQATAVANNARAVSITNVSASGFTAWPTNNTTTVYYIAIGN